MHGISQVGDQISDPMFAQMKEHQLWEGGATGPLKEFS